MRIFPYDSGSEITDPRSSAAADAVSAMQDSGSVPAVGQYDDLGALIDGLAAIGLAGAGTLNHRLDRVASLDDVHAVADALDTNDVRVCDGQVTITGTSGGTVVVLTMPAAADLLAVAA